MAHITVGFAQMQDVQQTLSDTSNQVFQASSDFQAVMRRLDWEVKSKSDIESRARRLTHKLEDCRTASRNYSAFVNTAYVKYAELENYQRGLANVGNVTPFPSGVAVNGFSRNGEQKTEEEETVKAKSFWEMVAEVKKSIDDWKMSHIDNMISWLKTMIDEGKKTDGTLAVIADFIGFIENIVKMINGEEEYSIEKVILTILSDITDFLGDLYNRLKILDDNPLLGIISKIINVVNESIEIVKTAKEKGLAKVLSTLDSLIESIGTLIRTGTDAIKVLGPAQKLMVKGVTYAVCGVLTFTSRLAGDCMTFSEDGELDGKEIMQAAKNAIISGGGTVIKLISRGTVDVDVNADGTVAFK